MPYTSAISAPDSLRGDTLVYFLYESDKPSGTFARSLDDQLNGLVSSIFASGEFTGKKNTQALLRRPPEWGVTSILLVGLGAKTEATLENYRQAAGVISRLPVIQKSKSVFFDAVDNFDADNAAALVEGFELGSWKILDYKTGEAAKSEPAPQVTLVCATKAEAVKVERGIARGNIIAHAVSLCRTLQAQPSNVLTADTLAEEALALGRQWGFKVRALDKQQIEREKMGALLAVNQGSVNPPRFIIMEYKGGRAGQPPIVLVGKGVTFDTGGISLKPGLNMHEMKADMTGAAVVISTMAAVARLKLKQNVVGLVPSTDNMPSGSAYKPGDIITARNGKTIEIINTDAEGRLILADALDYANKFKPQAVIDIATLTGATIFILGYAGAPIVGTSQQILDQLKAAAESTAEKVWQLPLWPEHAEQMKSPIADLVNSGGRPAGTLTAAAFLREFIGDYPWAHIDIAYVDQEYGGKPYVPKGPSGFGARLLIETLSQWKKVTR
ncbi:MAG TPA: leucyl aminopeptidase [candidate division Zixibacteria bacterium]|nr:leucyl aminopeptidase [candidate division Zixibacteria bacterium]